MDQVLSVTVVLTLLGAMLWLLRRKGAIRVRGGGAGIDVVASRALAPGHTLHVVEIRGRTLVIETHPAGCVVIEEQVCSASR